MKLILKKNDVVITQGMVRVISSDAEPTITYDDELNEEVGVTQDSSVCLIQPARNDIKITIDICHMERSSIEVRSGLLAASAVGRKASDNVVGTGAIEINIEKSNIGELYMKVAAGTIIADSRIVKILRCYPNGFEGWFTGDLKNQRTNLFVEAGAILCKVQ